MQTSITWWPIITHKTLACVACLCLRTAWPRGEESRFNASFNVTLDASQSAGFSSLVLQRTQMTWTIFMYIYIYIYQIYSLQFLKINLYLLMHYNINASIISDKQIRKRTKLFRRSVQLIERQVLSTDLRGYRGEFLIWSWGLKNKVLFSMNFLTNFGLTSNTKSCAIFNSECMLVFAACSLLFRENQVKKLIHWGPL